MGGGIEQLRIAGKDVLCAVAVMHVEIHHGDSPESVNGAGMQRANRNIVEQAKPHRLRPLRVMSRRPHGAEGTPKLATHHAVDSSDDRARGMRCRLRRTRRHKGIGIDSGGAMTSEAQDGAHQSGVMHA